MRTMFIIALVGWLALVYGFLCFLLGVMIGMHDSPPEPQAEELESFSGARREDLERIFGKDSIL